MLPLVTVVIVLGLKDIGKNCFTEEFEPPEVDCVAVILLNCLPATRNFSSLFDG